MMRQLSPVYISSLDNSLMQSHQHIQWESYAKILSILTNLYFPPCFFPVINVSGNHTTLVLNTYFPPNASPLKLNCFDPLGDESLQYHCSGERNCGALQKRPVIQDIQPTGPGSERGCKKWKRVAQVHTCIAMQLPVSFSVSLEQTVHLRQRQEGMEINIGRDREERALCKERDEKKKGSESCSSDWEAAGWEQTLEKSQTPGETQGHCCCGILPSCISLTQITSQVRTHPLH